MKENFRPISGFEFYEISDAGTVLSTKRKTPKNLKACPIKAGYLVVGLFKNNVQETKAVHRLVAQTFIPNPQGYPEVIHIDSDKTNNAVANLKWGTSAESIQNSIVNGRRDMPAGESHYKTFLTSEQVKNIREFCAIHGSKETYTHFSDIKESTLYGILKNKNWKDE